MRDSPNEKECVFNAIARHVWLFIVVEDQAHQTGLQGFYQNDNVSEHQPRTIVTLGLFFHRGFRRRRRQQRGGTWPMDPPRKLFVPERPHGLLPRQLKVPVPITFSCAAPLATIQQSAAPERAKPLLIEDDPTRGERARALLRQSYSGRMVYRWFSPSLCRRLSQAEFSGAVRDAAVTERLLMTSLPQPKLAAPSAVGLLPL